MNDPVCAHMNLGPHTHRHIRANNPAQAVREFRVQLENFYGSLVGILDRTGPDNAPCVDLYPQCKECNSQENHHDYPFARYQVGPRGGIKKVCV